jgi:hypothetical protein
VICKDAFCKAPLTPFLNASLDQYRVVCIEDFIVCTESLFPRDTLSAVKGGALSRTDRTPESY